MDEKVEPLLKVSVGQGRPDLDFYTVDEVEAFVKHEVEFWRFLEAVGTPSSDSYRAYVKGLWDRVVGLQTALTQYQADQANYFGTMRKAISRLYGAASEQLPSGTSVEGVMLKALADELSTEAYCVAFQYVVRQGQVDGLTLNRPDHLQGLIAVANGRMGISSQVAHANSSALAVVRDQYLDLIEKDRARQERANARWSEIAKSAQSQLQSQLSGGAQALSDLRSSKLVELDQAMQRIAALEQTYQEKLRLEAPTSYWEEKRSGHRQRAVWYGRVCLLFAAVVAGFGFFALGETLNSLSALSPETHLSVYLLLAAKTLVVFVVAFWTARILVRRYLSELHLAMDAQERTTMVMTYLALTETGKISEAERSLVLQPLFRSTADGIVKDDASMDPLVTALLARAASVRV